MSFVLGSHGTCPYYKFSTVEDIITAIDNYKTVSMDCFGSVPLRRVSAKYSSQLKISFAIGTMLQGYITFRAIIWYIIPKHYLSNMRLCSFIMQMSIWMWLLFGICVYRH